MKLMCDKHNTKWCPLKEKCKEYHPREINENEDINFSCTDNKDKWHDCKYIEVTR